AALELDVYEGSAFVGVTPFRMTGVRPVLTPPIPTATDFPELNVRTYVRHDGRGGVWFFSLDAASLLAVLAARTAIGLPYFQARMSERRIEGEVHYESRRMQRGAASAEFRARYRPSGAAYRSDPGTR